MEKQYKKCAFYPDKYEMCYHCAHPKMKQACLYKNQRDIDPDDMLDVGREPNKEEVSKPKSKAESAAYEEYKRSSLRQKRTATGPTKKKGTPKTSKRTGMKKKKRHEPESSESSTTMSSSDEESSSSESDSSSGSSGPEPARKKLKKGRLQGAPPMKTESTLDAEVIDDSEDEYALVSDEIKMSPRSKDLADFEPVPIREFRWNYARRQWQAREENREMKLTFVHTTAYHADLNTGPNVSTTTTGKDQQGPTEAGDEPRGSMLDVNSRKPYPPYTSHYLKISHSRKENGKTVGPPKPEDDIVLDMLRQDDVISLHYYTKGAPLVVRIQTTLPLPDWMKKKTLSVTKAEADQNGQVPTAEANDEDGSSWALALIFQNTPTIRKRLQEIFFVLHKNYSQAMPGILSCVNSTQANDIGNVKSSGKLSLISNTRKRRRMINSVNVWNDEVLCKVDDMTITKGDFNRLYPEIYLNDAVVDFFVDHVCRCIPEENKSEFLVLKVNFFTKVSSVYNKEGKTAVKKLVSHYHRSTSFFTHRYVLIPVNTSNHWMLVAICFVQECFYVSPDEKESKDPKATAATGASHASQSRMWVFDSLNYRQMHPKVLQPIREFLVHRVTWEKEQNLLSSLPKTRPHPTKPNVNLQLHIDSTRVGTAHLPGKLPTQMPKQKNKCDCGVYLCTFLKHICTLKDLASIPVFKELQGFTAEQACQKREEIQQIILDEGNVDDTTRATLQAEKAAWVLRKSGRTGTAGRVPSIPTITTTTTTTTSTTSDITPQLPTPTPLATDNSTENAVTDKSPDKRENMEVDKPTKEELPKPDAKPTQPGPSATPPSTAATLKPSSPLPTPNASSTPLATEVGTVKPEPTDDIKASGSEKTEVHQEEQKEEGRETDEPDAAKTDSPGPNMDLDSEQKQ